MTGTVKNLILRDEGQKTSGYGFITGDDDQRIRFFHANDLIEGLTLEQLQVGDRMEFLASEDVSVTKRGNGLRCETVRRA